MSKSKAVIDYLSEDQPIPGQKFALISIVGPNMKQKCDVWGLKIRGVADSLEKAKDMTKRIMRQDKDYDIYNVEVGKFFPLAVEPYDIQDVEYENEQLNALVKNYLENKEKANEHWNERKQEMMKEALREGLEQPEKPEHPIAVLQRINQTKEDIIELKKQLEEAETKLRVSSEKYDLYTAEEKQQAEDELRSAISQELKTANVSEEVSKLSIEDIRKEIMNELAEEE
jgi:hypothetical protein